MGMLDKITKAEYEFFNERRINYSEVGSPETPVREVLANGWAAYKVPLFHLMGEELILSKEIAFEASDALYATRFNEKIHEDQDESAIARFLNTLIMKMDSWKIYELNGSYDLSYFVDCIDGEMLTTNRVKVAMKGQLPNDVKINAPEGAKVIRILGKYAEAYGLQEEFEAFRLEHSQVLNTKKFTGELCISIHPLDFSTMSDNENGWSSCMSWWDEGEYRAGTVEMMNSDCVVVAYLKDSKLTMNNGKWNSKKWRELFVVNKDIIAGIKGYPYQSPLLETEVINWLRELAAKAWDVEYTDPVETKVNGCGSSDVRNYYFQTDTMYNDFSHRNNDRTHLISENINAEGTGRIYVDYSGPRQCMSCGDLHGDYEHEGSLCCEDCAYPDGSNRAYCSECGCRLYYSEDQFYLGDDCYCEGCYNDIAIRDYFTDDCEHSECATEVYIVPNLEQFQKVWDTNKVIPLWSIAHFPLWLNHWDISHYARMTSWKDLFGDNRPVLLERGWQSCYVMTPSMFVQGADADETKKFLQCYSLYDIFDETYTKEIKRVLRIEN